MAHPPSPRKIGLYPYDSNREADTIPTDAIPKDDRDRVTVLGIGLVVGWGLVTLLHSIASLEQKLSE